MNAKAPFIDWEAIAPLLALTAGACVVLLIGLARSRFVRVVLAPVLTIASLGAAIGLAVWQWGDNVRVIEGTLAMDDFTRGLLVLFCVGAIAAVLMAARSNAAEEAGQGEFHSLLLSAVLGMVVLVGAENLVVLFLGFEVLSIPLYVLCATEMRRATSLESGLKYLIVGSVGSATLLYGLALLYGATGSLDYGAIADAVEGVTGDALFLTALALILTGLAFKASVAPFHQWTPDVYEGAPTPVTGFMAVATKAAAFGVILRLFDVALIDAATDWAPALSVLAVATIVIGNVGALGQSSLKRLLAYSSIAQAGYMLAGVVVTTKLGIQAVWFYLAVYMLMNLAAFAVVTVRERETDLGDDIASLNGLGASRPWLAWPMTIAMLALAGLPGTGGFFGKIYLIEAAVDNQYEWLAVAIVLGSAISLAYYLRVIAAVWMSPAPGVTPGGSPVMAGGAAGAAEASGDRTRASEPPVRSGHGRSGEVVFVAATCALATVFFGIWPDPLFDIARDAGAAFTNLL